MTVERVVIDTNVLISAALNPRGTPRAVVEYVASSNAALLFSRETFDELRARLLSPKFDRYVGRRERDLYLARVAAVSDWVWIAGAALGCRDPDDDKLLETALLGAADFMVTGDRDLLVMSPFRGVHILSPAEFLGNRG
ncbi:MAG: putative toxin-antitoxin system toxin component, PIN family [Candidatus Tectomicrobia bacterium]|nr:putative toxin-antitoxin system toxin component, PIN family [Candidatus Tectomicrobia bacterium]